MDEAADGVGIGGSVHIDWAIFAARVEANPDGTVNVYSMGTPTVAFRSLPATIPAITFCVMCMFADSDQGLSHPLQATIIGTDGRPMVSEEVWVQRDDSPGKLLPFTFPSIVVERIGTYRARFEAGGQRREWPFHVAVRAPDESNRSRPYPLEYMSTEKQS